MTRPHVPLSVGFDTNVLAYLAGVDRAAADGPKIAAAKALVPHLGKVARLVAPLQALGELFVVLCRTDATREQAHAVVRHFAAEFDTAATGPDEFDTALTLATDHKLQLWDALILTAAADAGCSLLLSEDMQDGFATGGLTVANPFASTPHPKLAALLA